MLLTVCDRDDSKSTSGRPKSCIETAATGANQLQSSSGSWRICYPQVSIAPISLRRNSPAYNPRVSVDAAKAAEAVVETWHHLASAVPGGWARSNGAGVAAVTRVAVPTLNGVWVQKIDAAAEDV